MGEDGYQYFARQSGNRVTAVMRTSGAQVWRWIPHLEDWVEIPDHWDYLYDATPPARKISEDEAMQLAPDTVDLSDDVLNQRRARG